MRLPGATDEDAVPDVIHAFDREDRATCDGTVLCVASRTYRLGDIARDALVLVHFEQGRIT